MGNLGFLAFLGIYISGVVVAVIFHKIYFWIHPELIYKNQKILADNSKFDPETINLDKLPPNDDEDMFSPLNDEQIKMFIWLSWLTVVIWIAAFFLTIFSSVIRYAEKSLRYITNKII